MDNLQYNVDALTKTIYKKASFKPYYKWIIFNIKSKRIKGSSIKESFKPYYKWIIFNILSSKKNIDFMLV
mgnify:CR=1 FL=1